MTIEIPDSVKGSYWISCWKSLRIVGYILVTLWLSWFAAKMINRGTGRIEIEYDIRNVINAYPHPQNLGEIVGFTFDSKPASKIGYIDINLYNRTDHSIDDFVAWVKLNPTVEPVHRLLIFDGDITAGRWVSWVNASETELDFKISAFNANLSGKPNITIRLFFVDTDLPTVSLETDMAGVFFKEYDNGSFVDFYSWATVLRISVYVVIGSIAFAFGSYINDRRVRLRTDAFMREYKAALVHVFGGKQEALLNIVIKISKVIYYRSIVRFSLSQKNDISWNVEEAVIDAPSNEYSADSESANAES